MPDGFDLLIQDMTRAQRVLIPELLSAENLTLQKAENLAHNYSSGNVTTRQLGIPVTSGGFGHPYGLGSTGSSGPRGPIPHGDPSIINQQTGSFRNDWRTISASWLGPVISSVLVNFNQVADFLSAGTRFMIRRPIDDRIVSDIVPTRIKNLDNAVRRIFKFR